LQYKAREDVPGKFSHINCGLLYEEKSLKPTVSVDMAQMAKKGAPKLYKAKFWGGKWRKLTII
jgi:hypothetical protein